MEAIHRHHHQIRRNRTRRVIRAPRQCNAAPFLFSQIFGFFLKTCQIPRFSCGLHEFLIRKNEWYWIPVHCFSRTPLWQKSQICTRTLAIFMKMAFLNERWKKASVTASVTIIYNMMLYYVIAITHTFTLTWFCISFSLKLILIQINTKSRVTSYELRLRKSGPPGGMTTNSWTRLR